MKTSIKVILTLIVIFTVIIISILYFSQIRKGDLLSQENINQLAITKKSVTREINDKEEIEKLINIFNQLKYEKLNDFDEINKYGKETADYFITGVADEVNIFVIGFGKDFILVSEVGEKQSYMNKISSEEIELLKAKIDQLNE